MNLEKVKDFFKNFGQASKNKEKNKKIEPPKEPTRLEKLEQYRDKEKEDLLKVKLHYDEIANLIKQGRKELKPKLSEHSNVMLSMSNRIKWMEEEIQKEKLLLQMEEKIKRLEEEQAKHDEAFSDLKQLFEKHEELVQEIEELKKEQREWKKIAQKGNPKAQSKLEKINANLEQLQSQLLHIEGAIKTETERMDNEMQDKTEENEEL